MKWILIYIILQGNFGKMISYGEYDTMNGCFDARDKLIEAVGRPIVNYQAICIIKDEENF